MCLKLVIWYFIDNKSQCTWNAQDRCIALPLTPEVPQLTTQVVDLPLWRRQKCHYSAVSAAGALRFSALNRSRCSAVTRPVPVTRV